MIEKIIYTSMVTEVSGTSTRMSIAFKSTSLSSDVFLATRFTNLEAKTAELTAAINQLKADSILEEKDDVRDDKVRAIHYLTLGFLHHPDAVIKQAAQKVEKVFDKYGVKITKKSYVSESALIASLLNDFAKASLQESIAALSGLREVIAELQAAQSDFEQTRVDLETDKAEESIRANATSIKKEVVGIINDNIVVYLRAMEQAEEANYGNFARTIAEIIANNNETVKKRRKKKGDKPEE